LQDVPSAERADPRARVYIVDHVRPGGSVHRSVRVRNVSSRPRHVDLYAAAASIHDDVFTAADGRTGNELSRWIHLKESSVDLAPWAAESVPVTIAVPETASAGERYAAIFAQVASPPANGSTITQISRVGIRAYLDVSRGGKAPVTDFRVDGLAVRPRPGTWPLITAQVHNIGQRALDLTGSVSMRRAPGTTNAGPYRVQTGVTIPPGQVGQVTAVLNEPLAGGRWKAHLVLQSGTVRRTADATLTLPGPPKSKGTGIGVALVAGAGGAVGLAGIVVGLFFLYRFWSRRRPGHDL